MTRDKRQPARRKGEQQASEEAQELHGLEEEPEEEGPEKPQRGVPRNTPFARVLSAYLWSKTPPWSAGKLAAVLGLHRVRVAKWVYGDTIPELDTMLAVMARLNIPVRALVDAYAEAGVPVPPLDNDDATAADQQARMAALGPTTASRYPINPSSNPPVPGAIPEARQGRGGGIGHTTGYQTSQPPSQSPLMSQISEEERQRQAEEEADQQWQTMLTHTRKIMRMTGMKDSAIDAMLQSLSEDRARHRGGQPSTLERRRAEEFREQPQTEQLDEQQDEQQEGRQEGQSGRRHDTPLSR